MKLKKEVYDVLMDAIENGIDDPEKLTFAIEAAANVIFKICEFEKVHNLSLECGSEWLFQSDKGRIDALDLVGNILDELQEYSSYEGE